MTFRPVIPAGGYTGWRFLARTMETQKANFTAGSTMQRDMAYFREKISTVTTAEELVADRRLLGVALGAFGLDADINSRFFIRKVLEDGTLTTDALANRMSDKRYLALSKAFGFGDYSVPRTQLSDFADKILAQYSERQFEVAVGESDDNLRLALNARRELAAVATGTGTENKLWYDVMGSAPLRQVFQTAFGMPAQFGTLDIDQQLTVLKDRSSRYLGGDSVRQFGTGQQIEKLVRLFLLRSEAAQTTQPGSTAVQLLQGGSSGGLISLLL